MKKPSLPLQIALGIVAGFVFAALHSWLGLPARLVPQYIKPIGQIFINSLKASAIPLVITSLIVGVNSVQDTKQLSRISLKTLLWYFTTTICAVCAGLLLSNTIRPGKGFPQAALQGMGVLRPTMLGGGASWMQGLAAMVPENLFLAFTDNENLLFIVCFAIFFAVALLRVAARQRKAILLFCEGLNNTFVAMLQMVMKLAPLGVAALITEVLVEVGQQDRGQVWHYLTSVSWYTGTVLLALAGMTFLFYPMLVVMRSQVRYGDFLAAMRPVQLIAFSSCSSSATLPLTIKHVGQLGVPEEVSSFVLPLGATINMDGTAIYQTIATVFIAQAFGIELSLQQQLMVAMYITLSSIGTAGVPGVSLGSTTLLLGMLGIPPEGLALIMVPERILDMCRTVTNITGDAAVATVVASSEGKLRGQQAGPASLNKPL